MPIPLFDTTTPLEPLGDELNAAVATVLRHGRYILGPEVGEFEREFADYIGVGHAVGVGNGTDALTIALRAAGVEPGDEVIVPSLSFYASAEAIPPTGATPVFCDVDPATCNLTVESVEAVRSPRTRAVIAVDLFGRPAPIAEIREQTGLIVVEDAAQAAGASRDGVRAGALGDVATFSFFPSKNLGCFGDGGAIVTDDEEIAKRARMLRFHGSYDKVHFEEVGCNSRLDTIQATVLRVLLPHLDEWTAGRRAAAGAYERAGLPRLLRTPPHEPGVEPAWHLYVVQHPQADALVAALAEAQVQARGYYRTPIHRQPAMAKYAAGVELPHTDELASSILALPMSPVLTEQQAERVTAALGEAIASFPAALDRSGGAVAGGRS
ncbi:MAG: DegT/DnrJ/EryC1/StrS family aminotransferase [Solirubrobacteraceae bacterium]